ncbi:MAG: hypothetical protein ONB24_06235 [candidate division KSB1 bacterium]|nr:hypothetical protein [candidate division KSB1 bacterium]
MRKIFGLILSAGGAALFFFRMPLVYALIGKTKTKVGLFLGIDKLELFLALLWVLAGLLTLAGVALIFTGFFRRTQQDAA